MNPENLEIYIERLVVEGLAAGDSDRIGEALERELDRLFAEQEAPSSLAPRQKVARLDRRALEVKPGAIAEAIGVQVAQAVYERLS